LQINSVIEDPQELDGSQVSSLERKQYLTYYRRQENRQTLSLVSWKEFHGFYKQHLKYTTIERNPSK